MKSINLVLNPIKALFLVFVLVAGFSHFALAKNANDIIGTWQSFDDKTNLKKGQVEFSYDKKSQSYIGRIIKVTPAPGYTPKKYCDACPKPFKGKKVEGLLVIWRLKADVDSKGEPTGSYSDGYLLDPVSGKIYRVKVDISPSSKTLKIRAHVGLTIIGRTQTWTRIK